MRRGEDETDLPPGQALQQCRRDRPEKRQGETRNEGQASDVPCGARVIDLHQQPIGSPAALRARL
jgi:hypothetical protein